METERVVSLTVVQDGNDDIIDAFEYADQLLNEGKIAAWQVTASMAEDNVVVLCYESHVAEVKVGFTALKYQVV